MNTGNLALLQSYHKQRPYLLLQDPTATCGKASTTQPTSSSPAPRSAGPSSPTARISAVSSSRRRAWSIRAPARTPSTSTPFVRHWSWPSGKVRGPRVGADCSDRHMDLRTKGLLKPAYVDTADEVYFTYSITNESPPVCSSSSASHDDRLKPSCFVFYTSDQVKRRMAK